MANKSFIIKSKAIEDVERICDYISKDNNSAVLKLINTFNKSFEKLAAFPNLGIIRKDLTSLNVRFFVIKKHYLIVYNTEDDKICILRVLTSYQDICAIL